MEVLAHYLDTTRNHLFYLAQRGIRIIFLIKNSKGNSFKNLKIYEEDLETLSIINIYDVPEDPNSYAKRPKDGQGYCLTFSKKRHILVLTYPNSYLTGWDVESGG